MITIGLVGGVACGKSLVASHFQKLGACVLDGDRIGHDVLQMSSIQDQLLKRWGDRVQNDEGGLDRAAIAGIVFAEGDQAAQELAFLETLTHPEIGQRISVRLDQIKRVNRFPLAILDAAVMFKAGWDSMCDQIVLVDAPAELREKRAMLRGLSREQFCFREGMQTSLEEKRKLANLVIDNSGPPQQTFQLVEEVWQSLLQIA